MIFALITLFTALSLASVAGWFSIVGFMAIYAGAPIPALIMGAVTELAKLVTISWIYRNWEYANWRLKAPLIYFTIALMTATSIGVFGFLSKAHLEQGAGTVDNSSRIETLNYQINREKSSIADNEKVIGQLDATVNSFLGKDRTDRSLSVRKSQAPQRKQLRDDSEAAQKRIDTLSAEKFKLESEVRKMQLEVGPIRYIAELFYGVEEDATKNIESAVRLFTLLIVSTLDPLAVILLIAANHTLLRLRNEKKEDIPAQTEDKTSKESGDKGIGQENSRPEAIKEVDANIANIQNVDIIPKNEETEVYVPLSDKTVEINEKTETYTDSNRESTPEIPSSTRIIEDEDPMSIIREITEGRTFPEAEEDAPKAIPVVVLPTIKTPNRTRVVFDEPAPVSANNDMVTEPAPISSVAQDAIFRELRGTESHFTPQKVIEPKVVPVENKKTFPNVLSWLSEFKGK
jgi:hypothetical protein